MDERFYNIFMYMNNKNILEYGQIARNGTESVIPDSEGRSTLYQSYQIGCQSLSLSMLPRNKGIKIQNSNHVSFFEEKILENFPFRFQQKQSSYGKYQFFIMKLRCAE